MNPKFMKIILAFIICQTILVNADVEPLKSSADLDPLNDTENSENTEKEQEKRTIFNPTIKNVAWAKHVAVKPSGAKFIIGYGPVDLKYQPVLKPIAIKHQGYHYNRPKIHFHIKRPIIHIPQIKPSYQTEWKPILKPVPIVKPAPIPVPIHIHPEVHVDQLHLNPVPHIDHIHKEPVVHVGHSHPVHLDHVHHVHHVSAAHVEHVHHVPIQQIHGIPHIHAIPQARPPVLHTPIVPSTQLLGSVFPTTALKEIPAPQLIPQLHNPVQFLPAVPAAPVHEVHPVTHLHPVAPVHLHPVAPAYPVAPVQPVAHPVPVHPIGAFQPAHVNTISHFQTPGHVFPLNSFDPGDHVHHGDHIHPVGHLHPLNSYHPGDHVHHGDHIHPVGHLHPLNSYHPGDHVHHGDHIHPVDHLHPIDHINHGDHVHSIGPHPLDHFHPVGHLHPVNQPLPPHLPPNQIDYHEQHPIQSLLPNHYHLQYPQIPPQVHDPVPETGNVGQNFYPEQQHVPLDTQPQFQDARQNVYQQQPPYQQDSNIQDHYPHPQEDNRYQPASHVSSQHFFREGQFQVGDQSDGQGYVYPQPSQGRLIQPGQTDLQFPLHLPHHPAFDRNFEQDNRPEASQQNENPFRPSIQLEPPFRK